MMEIKSETNHLILRDNPGCFWFLGVFFTLIGSIVVLGTAGLFYNAGELSLLEKLFATLVGLSGVAAGLHTILRAPHSQVDFDLEQRIATIRRRRLFFAREIRLPFEEIYGFAVDESRDSSDSPVYRAAVIRGGGQVVPLSELWYHDRMGVKSTVNQVSQSLAEILGSN
jgi:hypothetical protein